MLKKQLSMFAMPLLLSVLAGLSGCGGKSAPPSTGGGASLTSLTLTPTNPTITLSKSPASTQPFDVIGHYSFGNPKDITSQLTWVSLDTTVATIDNQGVATATGSGKVIITGTIIDSVSGKTFQVNATLTVVPQLTGVTVSPSSAQIAKGTSQQFKATGQYNDGTTPDITALVAWHTTQSGVAPVSSSPGTQGLVAGQAAGSSSISASMGSVASNASSITVTGASLTKVSVTPANPTVPLATSQPLVATGTFSDGSTQDVSRNVVWSTLAPHSRIARVSSTGMATGLGLGTETVTATHVATGFTSSVVVTVDESSVAAVNVLPAPMVMFPGALVPEPVLAHGTRQAMRAVATIIDGSSVEITSIEGVQWTSSNTSVATIVPASGLLSAVSSGSATISAAVGSKSGSTALDVVNATIESLAVAPNHASVPLGGVQNVVAVATFLAPDGVTLFQQDVSNAAAWTGDANASVSYANGLQELAVGTTSGKSKISAALTVPGGSSAAGSATLNVTNGQLGSVNLVPGSTSAPLDGSRQFRALGNFTDGTQEDLSLLATWAAGDPTVAVLSPFGFSNATGPGQTNVSASFLNPVSGNPVSGSSPLLVNPDALVKIDICTTAVSNPVVNCPPLDPFPPPAGISLANQTQLGLVAIGTYASGNRQDLTDAAHWASSNGDAAAVSDDPATPGITTGVGQRGVVTGGITGGTSDITATAGGVTGKTTIAVTPATLQSLAVSPASGGVALGMPQQFTVTGTFSDGSKQDVTSLAQWSSLNPDIAVVNPGGLAYTTGKGNTTVVTGASSLSVGATAVIVTLANPSSGIFPWPVGTVFQLQGLTASSGDVSALNGTAFAVLSLSDPADNQHLQPCKLGQSCNITFAPPSSPPVYGSYDVTGGTAQASALLRATVTSIVNSELQQASGTATLTVQ